MKDPNATQEAKDKAEGAAKDAQKGILYMKKEVKREKDLASTFLAEA